MKTLPELAYHGLWILCSSRAAGDTVLKFCLIFSDCTKFPRNFGIYVSPHVCANCCMSVCLVSEVSVQPTSVRDSYDEQR